MASMDELKKAAGVRAADMIKDGMIVGLGTGSTAAHMVNRLAERIKTEGIHVTGVSTSWSTTLQCRSLGIPLKEMGEVSHLDMVIDGADEIDPNRNNYVIIADSGKAVQQLGTKFAVPLEIIPGAIAVVTERVKKLGGEVKVRMGAPGKDGPVISDSGNLIADAKFAPIADPDKLARDLEHIVGIVGHGLFINMATKVILADEAKGLIEF